MAVTEAELVIPDARSGNEDLTRQRTHADIQRLQRDQGRRSAPRSAPATGSRSRRSESTSLRKRPATSNGSMSTRNVRRRNCLAAQPSPTGCCRSALAPLFIRSVIGLKGLRNTLNYGADRIRYLSPVPAGSRLRGRVSSRRSGGRAAGRLARQLSPRDRDRRRPAPRLRRRADRAALSLDSAPVRSRSIDDVIAAIDIDDAARDQLGAVERQKGGRRCRHRRC